MADNAILVGDVRIDSEASIWYSAVLRAEGGGIVIGRRSNVQDDCVLHAVEDLPITLGVGVSVGHRAVLHGCWIGDSVLIGMGSVVLDGARVERGSVVAAGSLVPEGMVVPSGVVAMGSPAMIHREANAADLERVVRGAETYVSLSLLHRKAVEVRLHDR